MQTLEGMVPALKDDPATNEDEYTTYRYAFTPYVYVHEYTNSQGESASLLVVDYGVRW